MTGRSKLNALNDPRGGNVKNELRLQVLGAAALLGAGLLLGGCKSAPPLSKTDALALIQAKYDSAPPASIDVIVGDSAMQDGVTAGYWVGKGRYPNGYWADFTITPAGAKVLKLAGGGGTIQWRPDGPTDKTFTVTLTTVQTAHPKARDISDVTDLGDGKTADFTEAENLDALPPALQEIAHTPPNVLSQVKHANFALVNGAWTVSSIN
jgi:hypothetical protein